MTLALLLAHSGGWDEAAFVALPVALFGGLLAVANRRAQAEERRQTDGDQATDSDRNECDEELG